MVLAVDRTLTVIEDVFLHLFYGQVKGEDAAVHYTMCRISFLSLQTVLRLPLSPCVRELPENVLVTAHLEHMVPRALHQLRLYHSHFLESLLLPIFCVFTYSAINNPLRKHDPQEAQSGRWGRTN